MNEQQPIIDHAAKTITVCAWCYPGHSFLAAYRGYAAISYYEFNHSICRQHLDQQKWVIGGCNGPLWLQPGKGELNTVNK